MHPKRFYKTKSRHHVEKIKAVKLKRVFMKNKYTCSTKHIETYEKSTFLHELQHRTQYIQIEFYYYVHLQCGSITNCG